jgi:DNA helicase-2/ATP-dependent DNA helicase PcrA
MKFMEAAHVKDLLALLRILENPLDEVGWFRALQLPEGMGPASARRAMAAIGLDAEPEAAPERGPLARFLDELPSAPAAAAPELEAMRQALADCTDGDPPAAAQVERLRRLLEPIFARRYDSPAARLRDLEQLEALASRFPARARLLAELALDPPSSTSDLAGAPLLDEDYVVLSTIHSAKGGEWDVVHVIHASDGMIPSDMATGSTEEIEEERRLFYVALTRARDALYVYFPLRFYRRPRGRAGEDAHTYSQLTRFLPPDVAGLFDAEGLDPDEMDREERGVAFGSGRAAAGVDQFLAGLWDS